MDPQSLAPDALDFACAQSEIPSDGKVITRNLRGRVIAIARRSPGEDAIVAFESNCPHMKASFRFGRVVEGQVICPWHFFRFDTVTGETIACDKTVMKLKTYAVKVNDGKVYVDTMS